VKDIMAEAVGGK